MISWLLSRLHLKNGSGVFEMGMLVTWCQLPFDGGLVPVNCDMESTRADPFLGEEWKSALKGGYLSDIISHYMKHGGL